jgi:hypothetical protein
VINALCKCHDEVQAAQAAKIVHLIVIDKLETRK